MDKLAAVSDGAGLVREQKYVFTNDALADIHRCAGSETLVGVTMIAAVLVVQAVRTQPTVTEPAVTDA